MTRRLKQVAAKPNAIAKRPARPATAPADYSDEVSEKQLKAIERAVEEKADAKDEWKIVDGPAW